MLSFKKIIKSDNTAIKEIVVNSMLELGADPKTSIIADPLLNTMFENFQKDKAVYFVVKENEEILGGCGVNQLDGTTENICELQRMFLKKEARGKGIGKKLISMCLDAARDFGYNKIYLETSGAMTAARELYLKTGFSYIDKPLGNTGHGGCNKWMVLEL